VKVAALYRDVLKGKAAPDEAFKKLRALTKPVPFVNGFLYGREGMAWAEKALSV